MELMQLKRNVKVNIINLMLLYFNTGLLYVASDTPKQMYVHTYIQTHS